MRIVPLPQRRPTGDDDRPRRGPAERLVSSVELLWIARCDYRARWRLERHRHDYFQIIRFLSGRGQLQVGDEERPIESDALAFIHPDEPHGLTATGAVKTLDVKFRVRRGPLRARLMRVPGFVRDDDGSIAVRLERIRVEGSERRFGFEALCKGLMLEILLLLARRTETRPAPASLAPLEATAADPLVRRMLGYIDEHGTAGFSVRAMAASLGFTDRHLRQRFRQEMRQPIRRFLRRHRVRKAQELIAYSDHPLKQIAALTGFKDVHHFTRTFTAVTGSSPGAFRDRARDGIWKDVYLDPRFRNRLFTVPDEDDPA